MTFKLKKIDHKGFTILELLIATSVLSVILLLSTVSMISVGNLFYKGENEAAVQDDTRNITTDISQHLELGANVQNPFLAPARQNGVNVYALCIDNIRYTYALGVKVGTTLPHVLWRDTILSGASCRPANLASATPSAGGTEMIAAGSRLTALNLNSSTSPYALTVGVAFGDTSLTTQVYNQSRPQDVMCKGGPSDDDKYCATAYLTTMIDKRIDT